MVNQINDLLELKNYLKHKYNLNVTLNNSYNINKNINIRSINTVYIRLVISLLILFITIYIFIKLIDTLNKLNKSNKIYFYFLIILLIIILCSTLFYIQRYLFMIYFYNKNNKKTYDEYEEIVEYSENIKLNTGDILQEETNWNYNYGVLLYIFPIKFLHNIIVINFKNKKYGLHYINKKFGYPENILEFDSKHIELIPLDSYLKDNYHAVKNYRLFKIKKEVNNDKIFSFLKTLNMEKINFSFMPNINYCSKEIKKNIGNDNSINNKNHCMSFILKLLHYLNIIPQFNFQNFTSNDLTYLPQLSNNLYNDPIIMRLNNNLS